GAESDEAEPGGDEGIEGVEGEPTTPSPFVGAASMWAMGDEEAGASPEADGSESAIASPELEVGRELGSEVERDALPESDVAMCEDAPSETEEEALAPAVGSPDGDGDSGEGLEAVVGSSPVDGSTGADDSTDTGERSRAMDADAAWALLG